jgi:hypothetical protein
VWKQHKEGRGPWRLKKHLSFITLLADVWALVANASIAFWISLTLVHNGDTMLHCQPLSCQIPVEFFSLVFTHGQVSIKPPL